MTVRELSQILGKCDPGAKVDLAVWGHSTIGGTGRIEVSITRVHYANQPHSEVVLLCAGNYPTSGYQPEEMRRILVDSPKAE